MRKLHAILAGNYREAQGWAREQEIQRRDWIFIRTEDDLRGLNTFELHLVGTWAERPDLAAVREQALIRRIGSSDVVLPEILGGKP